MKKLSALILSASLLVPAASGTVWAAEESGYKFTTTEENGSLTIRGFSGSGETLTIPDEINGKPVTAIADYMFAGNKELISVTLPDGLKTIGKKVFSNCANLKTVSIGSDIDSIDEQAFSACPNLEDIAVSTDSKTYRSENNSLYKGDSLLIYAGGKKAAITDGTAAIGKYAFFGKTELTAVDIPDSVAMIDDYAFAGCLALKSIDLPDKIENIGNYCFVSCIELSSVELGSSLKAVPDSCFLSCTALKNLDIPDSVTKIGTQAFYCCDGIEKIYIPPTVTEIGSDALGRTYNLRAVATENVPSFIIYGESGSAAEKYASDMGIEFKEGKNVNVGDVNGDSVIDGKDASMTLTEYALVSAGKSGRFNKNQELAADYNSDGVVDGKDASAILSYYAASSVSN